MISAHAPWLLESQGPCKMHTFLDFSYSLPLLCLEWNSNPSETQFRNSDFYDISSIGDFYAGAGFVCVLYYSTSVSNLWLIWLAASDTDALAITLLQQLLLTRRLVS